MCVRGLEGIVENGRSWPGTSGVPDWSRAVGDLYQKSLPLAKRGGEMGESGKNCPKTLLLYSNYIRDDDVPFSILPRMNSIRVLDLVVPKIGSMLEKNLCNFRKPLISRRQIKWATPILILNFPICAMFEKYANDFCT